MRTRFLPLWLVVVLLLCTPAMRGAAIDPSLLAKANAGELGAQVQLGDAYFRGKGVRRDYARAAIWYRKAADQGDADSQYMLGGLYHLGEGVQQDDAQAFAWSMKAAEQGQKEAAFFISTCYRDGQGVAKDDVKGMVWLRKAAEQGVPGSQFVLASFYHSGIGVPQDDREAYFWLALAASGEGPRKWRKQAMERRDQVASYLTPAELSGVQKRVQKWLEDHPAESQ